MLQHATQDFELVGQVRSGLGEGASFTSLEWALGEFRNKLGFAPFPGTFNLSMNGAEWMHARQVLDQDAGIAITPAAGYCGASCYPVLIEGHFAGAAVIPDVSDYPHDKLEILSPVALREALDVVDGDRIRLRLSLAKQMVNWLEMKR